MQDLIYKKAQLNGESCHQLLLPSALKTQVLHATHDNMGHQAFEKTLQLVQARCWWPGMSKDVEVYYKQCRRCVVSKAKKVKSTMGTLLAKRPLEVLAIDFTPLEPTSSGIENALVLTDVFTRYTQVIPTKDQKARTVASFGERLVCAIRRATAYPQRPRTQLREHSRQGTIPNLWHRQKSHDPVPPTGKRTDRAVQSDVTRSTTNLAK